MNHLGSFGGFGAHGGWFRDDFGTVWVHLERFRDILGGIWGRFGVTGGPWGRFGAIFSRFHIFWAHCDGIRGQLGSPCLNVGTFGGNLGAF